MPWIASAQMVFMALLSLANTSWAADPIVLLMTSPREAELKNIRMLRKQGLLQIDKLQLVGIYHSQEEDQYQSAQKYISTKKLTWISLRQVHCSLSPQQVFRKNDCTDAYRALWRKSDGIIFTGGADIPPKLYGQASSLLTAVNDPARHWFEISLLVHLLRGDPSNQMDAFLTARPHYLVLGLCLGMQTMNVALGGTLIQDIPSQIYKRESLEDYAKLSSHQIHRNPVAQLDPHDDVGWGILHRIRLLEHPLAERFGKGEKEVQVLSLHHQAVGRLGKDLLVWARSLDGKVTEGVAHRSYQAVVGVQFHPEKRVLLDRKMVYRLMRGAQIQNHIAHAFAKDVVTQRFQQRFWAWFSESLRISSQHK